jgi:hypothetical protein
MLTPIASQCSTILMKFETFIITMSMSIDTFFVYLCHLAIPAIQNHILLLILLIVNPSRYLFLYPSNNGSPCQIDLFATPCLHLPVLEIILPGKYTSDYFPATTAPPPLLSTEKLPNPLTLTTSPLPLSRSEFHFVFPIHCLHPSDF